MTVLLLLLCIVVAVLAHRRQARRIGRLEERVTALMRGGPIPVSSVDAGREREASGAPGVPMTPATADARFAEATRPARVILSDPPAPPAPPGPPPEMSARAPVSAMFEQIVGGRLPIWVGGAALAIAGYFLVRLAIESGLLTPSVRVLLAALFGFALLAAGEGAARLRRIAEDPRVAQALSGAGIATLYAAIYLAGSRYGLIGPVAGFALLAAITAAAILLSLRRGAPVALMALAGGFATPLLAGAHGRAILPLLAYLALLSAGLLGLAAARGWVWLALCAAAGSLAWSGALIATAAPGDALAAGGLVLPLAIAATLAVAASGRERAAWWPRALPLAVGAAELALLIATTGFDGRGWSLYLLLAAAAIFLGRRDRRLVPAVAAALGLAAVALAASALHGPAAVAAGAAIGLALLFGGAGHASGRRAGDGAWWAGIGAAGLVLPYAVLGVARPGLLPAAGWSALALAAALPPLHLAWRGRKAARAALPFDAALAIAGGTAAALLAEGARRIGDGGLARLARVATVIALAGTLMANRRIAGAIVASLAGRELLLPLLPPPADAIRGALLPGSLLLLAAWRAADPAWRRLLLGGASVTAAAGLYVLWKQLFGIVDPAAFVARAFLERALLTQAIFAAGWAASRRGGGWEGAARLITAIAALRVVWLDLAVFDPAFVEQAVGPWPIVNLAAVHFLAAALWIERAWRAEPPGRGRSLALAALVAVAGGGTLLAVRQAFHGSLLVGGPPGRAEFYGYSAGGVLLAVVLFARGAWLRDRALRIAGLGLLTGMVLKVFLIDAAALAGLLRVASFLGLGVTLIAIGWAYGRLLGRAPPSATVG